MQGLQRRLHLGKRLILWYVQKELHVQLRCEACRTLNKNRNSQQSPSRPASRPTKLPFIPDTRPPLMRRKPKEVQPSLPEMNAINYPALQSTKKKSLCQQQHEESSDEQDDDVKHDFQDSEVPDPNIDMNLEHEDPPDEQHSGEENDSQDSKLPSLQSSSSSTNSGSIQESRPSGAFWDTPSEASSIPSTNQQSNSSWEEGSITAYDNPADQERFWNQMPHHTPDDKSPVTLPEIPQWKNDRDLRNKMEQALTGGAK